VTVSAKRRGITDDPEQELRFRRIEEELDARALANVQTGASGYRRGKSTVPQLSGVRLDNNIVGGVGVTWNSTDIPDLAKYQLQYDTDASFLNATTLNMQATNYTLPNLSAETTYHVRVRAFNSRGDEGPWSSTLNAQSGQASVSNLADGSASNIVVRTKTAGFVPATVGAAGSTLGSYLNTRLSFPVAAETLLIGVTKGVTLIIVDEPMYVRMKIDGQTKIEFETNFSVLASASTGTFTVPGLIVPVLLSSGSHSFSIDVEIDDGGSAYFTPSLVSLAIWQVRK